MKKTDKKNIEDIYALTPMQEGLLFHYLKAPGKNLYHGQLCLEISGETDIHRFTAAWNRVAAANEMLRTVFQWEQLKNPLQITLKEHLLHPRYYDFSHRGEREAKKAAAELTKQDRAKTFDLNEIPFRLTLCKIKELTHHLIITNHHILYDGWSTGIILKEFFTAHDNLCTGTRVTPPLKTRFKEFVKWRRGREAREEETYWRSYLSGFAVRTLLPFKQATGEETTETPRRRITFSSGLKKSFDRFVQGHKITPAALFHTAWGLLLQKYNNSDDVIFGSTTAGRAAPIKGIEEIVGLFINTLPVRVQSPGGETVQNLLRQIDTDLKNRAPFESTPLVDLGQYSQIPGNEELFDSLVVMENYPLDTRLMGKTGRLSPGSYTMVERTHYDLTLAFTFSQNQTGVDFIYNNGLLTEKAIARLARHFKTILRQMIENPGQTTAALEIITEEEKERILIEFNDTGAEYPQDKTVHELFAEQARQTPDQIALVGSRQTQEKNCNTSSLAYMSDLSHMSYGLLNEKSNRLAHRLRKKGIRPDTLVALRVERSIAMMMGILGILKAGGAYLPIETGYPRERIDFILKDSRAKILVTTGTLVEEGQKVKRWEGEKDFELVFLNTPFSPILLNPDLPNFRTSQPPNFPLFPATGHRPPVTSLAYIIYTSGSTGKPRGVMVMHRSVVNILTALQHRYPLKKTDTYLLKTSVVFDVSVTELFGWFPGGGKLAVLEKGAENDPGQIAETIRRHRVTHINFVPSMFKVFIDLLTPRDLVKLSSLKYIFVAGEALLAEPVNKFKRLPTGIALENLYGPTEGTVYACGYSLAHWQGKENIPIGKPLRNIRLYILDKNSNIQPPGIPGELYIAGHGVARGYLNNPGLTQEKFYHDLKDYRDSHDEKNRGFCRGSRGAVFSKSAPLAAGGKKIYHTGDVARWLPDGNIAFLGRVDFQVKIRGFRIEPGEIESVLLKKQEIKEALVLVKENQAGDRYLCAYIVVLHMPYSPETAASLDIPGLRDYLSGHLPDYMVPWYFIRVEKIPLNANGKIDRSALPEPGLKKQDTYIAPGNTLEEKLVEIWSDVLAIKKELISLDANFFRLGGHSLKAAVMAAAIHKELNVKLSLTEIFKRPSPAALASYLQESAAIKYIPIPAIEKKEYYDASDGQKRVWTLSQSGESSLSFNIPGTYLFKEEVDRDALDKTFKILIERHESLRTLFFLLGTGIKQRVLAASEMEFSIAYQDLRDVENKAGIVNDRITAEIDTPFDLARGPLLRARLLRVEEKEFLFLFTMHHIISDFLSLDILRKEVRQSYESWRHNKPNPLPPLRIQYKDYTDWRNNRLLGPDLEVSGKYWQDRFKQTPPVLALPYDRPRPRVRSFNGETLGFRIPARLTAALRETAIREQATLFMVLVASLQVLLFHYTGQTDITIGTPVAGREHNDLHNQIGLYLNTLALRTAFAEETTFTQLLQTVKSVTSEAYRHQQYPFDRLVERLGIKRDASRHPMFDVIVDMLNLNEPLHPLPHQGDPGETRQSEESPILRKSRTKADLIIYFHEEAAVLDVLFEYNTDLFERKTIIRMINRYKKLLDGIVENPRQPVADFPMAEEIKIPAFGAFGLQH